MTKSDRNLFRRNLVVAEDLSPEGYVVKSDEMTVSVYGCELRHHNRKLLENIIAECRVKPPLDSIDTESITYSTLFAYSTVRPNWDWERELFRDIALLSDTHLAEASLNRLKHARIAANRLQEVDYTQVPEEMWLSAIRTLEQDIQFYESRDYFHKDASKLPPLDRFLNNHGLEHPQIMINQHLPAGRDQSERQKHTLALQVEARKANGRAFVTGNGALQTFIPGNDPKTITDLTPPMASLWDELTREQKDLTILLTTKYNSQILAMLLVSSECSPSEFAQSILKCEGEEAHFEHSIGDNPSQDEIDDLTAFQWYNETREGRALEEMDEANVPRYNQLLADALVVSEYLELCSDPVLDLIKGGETSNVEFKSTFRRNIHTGKNDTAIEKSALKEVVAFLNTDGGHLIIGIQDDGSPYGLQEDGFSTEDRYTTHISNQLSHWVGANYGKYLTFRYRTIQAVPVLDLICEKLPPQEIAFLEGELYIRNTAQAIKLDTKEAMEWQNRRV